MGQEYQPLRPSINFGAVRDGRRSPVFYFDVDLTTARSEAAGTMLVLPVSGDSFYSDKDPLQQGSATITFQDTNTDRAGAPIYVEPGFIARMPFTQLGLTNLAQPGKILRFFYGTDIDFQPGVSSSVTVNGTVSSIDGNKARSIAGGSFGWRPNCQALAAKVSIAQLWNPAASGKRLIVDAMQLSVTAATAIAWWFNGGVISNLSSGQPTNLLAGGPAIVGTQARFENDPVIPAANYIGGVTLPAAGTIQIPLSRPLIVMPGTGLLISTEATNVVLGGFCQFFEEAF